jgi:hypothetical protein
MLHCQTKIIYPRYPFICNNKNLNNKNNLKSNINKYSNDDDGKKLFMAEVIKIINSSPSYISRSLDNDIEIIDFLAYMIGYDDNDNLFNDTFKNIFLAKVEQSMINTNNEINSFSESLMFHTACYYDTFKVNVMNNEYDTDIAWLVIPLIGNITMDNDCKILHSKNNNTNKKLTCEYVRPKYILNNILRNSTHIIKHNIMNNPRLSKIYNCENRKIQLDMYIKNIGNVTLMKNINDSDTNNDYSVVKKTCFDYSYESIKIKYVNNILQFLPSDQCKIYFHETKYLNAIYFVSVMRHNDNMHVTIHQLNK